MWRKMNPGLLLVGMYIGTTTMENSMETPLNSKNRTIIWSSSFAFGYLSEENENSNSKRYIHLWVNYSIIHNSQTLDTT